jgi:flagellar hook-basal body complex protein FliE
MPEPTRIAPISPQRVDLEPRALRTAAPSSTAPAKPFKEVLAESIGEVQRLQTEADTTIKKLVSGQIKDVSEVMVAVEKSDVAFQTMMTVRNHIVAAYEEVMRMQV